MSNTSTILNKAADAYKNGAEYAATFQQAIDAIFWDWADMQGQCPETQEVYCELAAIGMTPIR